jgi:cell division protein FtsQ
MLGALMGSIPGDRAQPDAGLVLPRPFRKPVRFLTRFCQGDITPPRYSALTMTAVLLSATAVYGTYIGGRMPAVAQAVTARTGFAVDEIKVAGNREVSEIDVLDRLELTGWTSLIGFDATAARDRIAKLPWVENASVRKVYPDTIEVKLDERQPFAIWQHDRQLSVIEPSGNIIAAYGNGTRNPLPLLLGLGAPETGASFVAKMQQFPEIASRVRAYVRIADRRWDLKLDNGVTVKLPEFGAEAALAELVAANRASKLLDRDVVSVDMRLADRLVVSLSDEAVARREALLKEEAAARKKNKPETRI